ncbi:podocan [Erythrolamprus reginae]|uniref:podocan n=1 Tax=Erythrolamprus reginae TaxID=121349 RepID=UPI00396CF1E6
MYLKFLFLFPVLWPLILNSSRIQGQNNEDSNEFPEHSPELLNYQDTSLVPDCPKKCSCTSEGIVDCGGFSLKEFPMGVPEMTSHLSLQNNQIETIIPEQLARLPWLETLNLQNNRLTSKGLPENTFDQLENLNYLYLANNQLTMAPKFLPQTLISVDFAANNLTKIYDLTFGQKPNLRSVYLHNNKLDDAGLPENMFNGSDNVEILIMSSNFLKYVPKNLPRALYKLHLKNNKLEKIPVGAFNELSDLRELYLQNNKLNNDGMDNETFWKLSSLEYLDLSSNNLSQIPPGLPRNVVLLHLEKNAIKSIGNDVLTQIKNLEYLLLHNNKLKARDIDPMAFHGLKKLHTVHLYNNLLEKIPSGLPRRVKTLMILYNQISEIGREDFATTYFMEELNLSYNKITSTQIHRESFRKLKRLKSLDLSGNKLRTMPYGFPKNLQSLKLKVNLISSIPKGTLSGMSNLQELFLSANKLKNNLIHSASWRDLTSLKVLDMAANHLTSIPSGLPETLEYLYLQSNKISIVPENAFDSTPNIKGIYLRFNKIAFSAVKESTFQRLKHLQVLDIEGNFEFSDPLKNEDHSEEEMEEED